MCPASLASGGKGAGVAVSQPSWPVLSKVQHQHTPLQHLPRAPSWGRPVAGSQHPEPQSPGGSASLVVGTLDELAQAAEELGRAQTELTTLPRCQPLGFCFSLAHCFCPAPELVLEPLANEWHQHHIVQHIFIQTLSGNAEDQLCCAD